MRIIIKLFSFVFLNLDFIIQQKYIRQERSLLGFRNCYLKFVCNLMLDYWNLGQGKTGGPFGTVPELLFEKKGLIPVLEHLLTTP
jgi:hypothetical protein